MLRRRAHRHRDELGLGRASRPRWPSSASGRSAGMPLDELLDAAVERGARELERGRSVALLELTRDGRGLLVRAGVGLPDGVLGGVLPAARATRSRARRALARGLRSGGARTSRADRDRAGARLRRDRGAQPQPTRRFSADDDAASSRRSRACSARRRSAPATRTLVRDSEAQFRELADTTPALMWMTDAEGDVTFVNEGWLRFTGGTLARSRRHVRDERPPRRPRGAAAGLAGGLAPPRGVSLRVPAAPRRLRRLPLGARGGHAALLRRRVRGLRGHRHGHPRAPRDGGGAARVRGQLPRAGRHRAGDDVDHRRRTGSSRS